MKTNITEKEFFKIVNKGCRKFSEEIEDSFPMWTLEITFPFLTEDDINNAVYGLDRNDESIDAFFSHLAKTFVPYIFIVKLYYKEIQ